MDNSPLGKLSAELRNTISTMVLRHEHVLVLTFESESTHGMEYSQQSDNGNKYPCALAHTCKQLRSECTGEYYAINDFIIYSDRIGYHDLRAVIQDFTRNGELSLKSCTFVQEMDELSDEDMKKSFREIILNVSENKQSDGLEQLEAIRVLGMFLGEPLTLHIGRGEFLLCIIRGVADLITKLEIGGSVFSSIVSDLHGSACLLRAARLLQCLCECFQELLISPSYASGLRVTMRAKMLQTGAATSALVARYIAAQLMTEDIPCSYRSCQPREQV